MQVPSWSRADNKIEERVQKVDDGGPTEELLKAVEKQRLIENQNLP